MRVVVAFLLTFISIGLFAQESVSRAKIVEATEHLNPPTDTTLAPIKIGELRTTATGKTYIAISLSADQKWANFNGLIPTVADLTELGTKQLSDNSQYIVSGTGIFEWQASGTPDGETIIDAADAGVWVLVTSNIGPDLFSDLSKIAGSLTDNNKWIKFGTAILRYNTVANNTGSQLYRKQGQSFTWRLVDEPWNPNDTHRRMFTDTVTVSGASGLSVSFANSRAVVFGQIQPDESLAPYGIVGGGTIGTSVSEFRMFKSSNHTYQLVNSDRTSLNNGTEITLKKANTATSAYTYTAAWDDTKLKYDSITGLYTLRSFGVNSWTHDGEALSPIIEWAGEDSMYWARPVMETRDMTEASGTINWTSSTAWQKKFYLVNHLGEKRIGSLRSTDNLNIIQNNVYEPLSHAAADGRASGNFQKNILVSSGGTLRNYWVFYIMEVWADTYDIGGSSDIMVHWQQFRNGSGLATSYRLQEATFSDYSDAVDIYTGTDLEFRDTTPQRYYRLYATNGGGEVLVCSFNRKAISR